MRLDSADLQKLVPVFMRGDEAVAGLAQGGNQLVGEVWARVKLLSQWDQIDNMGHSDLDEFAWALNIFWYDSAASLATKRRLIKESDMVYAYLGTRWAVETVLSAFYGGVMVREWFEYDGEPFFFKLLVDNPEVTNGDTAKFMGLLNAVKRLSAWLEGIYVGLTGEMDIYAAIFLPAETSPSDLVGLVEPVADIAILRCKVLDNGSALVGGDFNNRDITEGFYYRELGLYAEDPDVGEILYCYGNSDNLAEWIPPIGTPTVIEKRIDIITRIDTATNVVAYFGEQLYVSREEFEAMEAEVEVLRKKAKEAAPPGSTKPFAGGTIPEGWLLCDGSLVSREEYTDLFAAINVLYGSGDGSTTFKLPDYRNRVPVGAGNSYSLAAIGGTPTVALTAANDGPHAHTGPQLGMYIVFSKSGITANSPGFYYGSDRQSTLISGGSYGTNTVGNGTPHENMPPYIAQNFIIKT